MSVEIGAAVVGIVAMAYGVGLAVLPTSEWSTSARTRFTNGGAGLVALLFLVLVFTPWFIQRA